MIVKAFMRHDMTPVTARIADAYDHKLILGTGSSTRVLPPGIPIDRLIGVLLQVEAGFALKVIVSFIFHLMRLVSFIILQVPKVPSVPKVPMI
jgi:hypothetical protein